MSTKNQPKTKRVHYLLKIILIVIFYFACNSCLIAQETNLNPVIKDFQDYTSAYREVAYSHLNKSIYIKGELLGFSSYIIDKALKTPSQSTKNLYCVIKDSNNNIIKSKLVKLDKGFAYNTFNIDSLFTSGNYTFKAYTNWMRNFDEPNAFFESFKVIDPDIETSIKTEEIEDSLDAQFLPEGGHFVDNVKTNVGVVIKNKQGYAIGSVQGNIYDSSNNFITSFETNALGIGRFLMFPQLNENYTIKIDHLNKVFEFNINNIEPKGISIIVNKSKDKLILELKTNESTLNDIKEKLFKLLIHNGKAIKEVSLKFNEKDIIKPIAYDELLPGINIFTLFDENNTPILERMFFNYRGIKILNLGDCSYSKLKDSMVISIPMLKTDASSKENNNFSISVLPEETKSYNRHHNIISHTYLQPYVKGYIENAAYYFTNLTPKKKYDLDNLLITQGWSSYSWENIFNNKVKDNFAFEDGIVLKANQNNSKQSNFILYPLKFNDGLVLNLSEDENSFVVSNLYPEGDEKLGLGTLNNKGKVSNPNLYLQFFPSKIPDYESQFEILLSKKLTITKAIPKEAFTLINLKEIQQLKEVIIKTNLNKTKVKKFQESAFNDVDVFDDKKRERNMSFVNYINQYVTGFSAIEQGGFISVFNRNPTSRASSSSSPIVYLDDVLISSIEMFIGFNMNLVDYVAVNRFGYGEGFLGANGVIRIYTSTEFKKKWSKTFKNYEIPLTFSENKKFYVPKYQVYNDEFFREYGVIHWIPNCKIDDNGNLTFKVYNPSNNNIKFFMEGITQSGRYLSDTKVLTINNN